jgi:integrase
VRDLWHTERDGKKVRTARYGSPGKRWLAVWNISGTEHTKAFARKDTADRHGPAQEAEHLRGAYISAADARLTVGEWCDVWLDGYGSNRDSTVRAARVHIRQIKLAFSEQPIGALRPSMIRSWCARLKKEGLEPSYIYALHRRLSQIYTDAVIDHRVNSSPCSRRTSPPPGKQRPYCASVEQVWALYDVAPEWLRPGILLGAFAGLRAAEACGARPQDLDLMRGIVNPAVQYPAEELKTEGSTTPVPIPHSMTLELSAHIGRDASRPFVMLDEDGDQVTPRKLNYRFAIIRKKVDGLPAGFRFHDLRHFLASYLIASGADVKVVQARMRHASAKTTLDVYGHLWPDSDESTRTALEAVFEARTEQRLNKITG